MDIHNYFLEMMQLYNQKKKNLKNTTKKIKTVINIGQKTTCTCLNFFISL